VSPEKVTETGGHGHVVVRHHGEREGLRRPVAVIRFRRDGDLDDVDQALDVVGAHVTNEDAVRIGEGLLQRFGGGGKKLQ
jgi:hypothetical protein